MTVKLFLAVLPLMACVACNDTNSRSNANQTSDPHVARHSVDTSCDLASYPSLEWTTCELGNWQRTLEANTEQLNPAFVARWLQQDSDNLQAMLNRAVEDPSWLLLPTQGNTVATPLCGAGIGPCGGDPFRYPGVDGPDGNTFYEQEAEVVPVVYYDEGCARISGQVWRPRSLTAGQRAPLVIIKNGSVQAGESLYWWMAQTLVRAGYVVLTNDPRGQGKSDLATPNLGEQGGNVNISVFYDGLVNDIDFMLSDPTTTYPHEQQCAGTYPTETASYNPFHEYVDTSRLGVAGHSAGALAVSVVQAYGAEGAEPWPGLLSAENPVDVVVAWDALGSAEYPLSANATSLPLPPALVGNLLQLLEDQPYPDVVANKPALSFTSEYGFTPVPLLVDPDREGHKHAFKDWQAADIPVAAIAIAGVTHLDFSLGPVLPATSWCAEVVNNQCVGGWARPMIEEYSLAWFDRWLKVEGEPGYADADSRLLNDAAWAERMSIHFASARDFPLRSGEEEVCEDIRLECGAEQ